MGKKKDGANGQDHKRKQDARGLWASLRARLNRPVRDLIVVPGRTRRALLIGLLYALAFALATSGTTPDGVDWLPGDVATHDIVAVRDVVNREQTDRLRDQAGREAVLKAEQDAANWEINPAEALRAEQRLEQIFAALHAVLYLDKPDGDIQAETGQMVDVVEEVAGDGVALVEADPGSEPAADSSGGGAITETDAELRRERVEAVLAEADVVLSSAAVQTLMTVDASRFDRLQAYALDITRTTMARERIGEGDVERHRAAVAVNSGLVDLTAAERDVVVPLVQHVLRPNLLLSPEKIDRARQEAARAVADVRIREGQIIIRRGDPVQAEHISLLQELGLLDGRPDFAFLAGIALLLALVFALVGVYLYQQRRHVFSGDAHLALVGLVALSVAGLAKVETFIAWPGAGFVAPVGLASLLITLLIDSRVAIIVTVALAVVVSALFGLDGRYFIVALAGGLAGVFSVSRVSERSDLTRAGFIIGGINFLSMIALGLFRGDVSLIQFSFLGLVNGLLAAVGTIGLLPYLETLFGITSSIRLLELSNPNHPLLRKLLMEAPGSYHHSMMVGNLAEAGAEAIGADQLLVRVGSQYHDIGKAKRPYFFVENQFGGENPHDKISPTLSTLIIMAHVKDGVELAKELKLPPIIIDFIREHHGTSLIRYFHNKALENAPEDSVDERDFRYAGPKPQSKETALVMLADGVEAAVRSLGRPTPGRIEGLVRRLVKERLDEGELDESNLTLRDLDKIADAFVHVLTGIFHKRIEYPEIGVKESDVRKLPDAEPGRA